MEKQRHSYSEGLKVGIVEEIESGRMSLREAAREASAGVTQVQRWLEEYGRYKPKRDVVEVVMKSEKDKISELEKALAELHLKVRIYEELINQANKKYRTDIKKNFGIQQQKSSVENTAEKKLKKSAASSTRRGTPITKGANVEGKRLARRQ